MMLAPSTAMLIKSWVREFDRGLRAMSIPEQRAKTREFRYLGMERWRLTNMVEILPPSVCHRSRHISFSHQYTLISCGRRDLWHWPPLLHRYYVHLSLCYLFAVPLSFFAQPEQGVSTCARLFLSIG